MKEKRLTVNFYGRTFREMRYFSRFFFTPAIATFTSNIYGFSNKWIYQRTFSLYFFWWAFSIDWKFREKSSL